jgi:hypothetical protein
MRRELNELGGVEHDVLVAARIVGDALGWDEGRRAAEEAAALCAGAG